MRHKIAFSLVAISLLILFLIPENSLGGTNSWRYHGLNAQNTSFSREYTKLQFFFNAGMYQPGLKQFNDAIKDFNQIMTTAGYNGAVNESSEPKVVVVIGSYPEPAYNGSYDQLAGGQTLGGGISYFLHPHLKLSLSLSYFETKAASNLSSTFWEEKYYPEVSGWRTANWRVDESVNIRPLLLSALYDMNIIGSKAFINFYGGGGLGFYFSTLKNTLNGNYGEPEPYTSSYDYQLTNYFQANANPIGFHALAGLSFGWKFFALNFDVSYHYAKGKIDNWNNSTSMQYYVYGMAKEMMNVLNVKEIDLGGLLLRGGLNLNF